jgi:hypothetical protein
MIDWKELSRANQNSLQCLYGGGSLRNCDPDAILRLRRLDLIEGKDRRERLSPLGWAFLDFTYAELKERMGARKVSTGESLDALRPPEQLAEAQKFT